MQNIIKSYEEVFELFCLIPSDIPNGAALNFRGEHCGKFVYRDVDYQRLPVPKRYAFLAKPPGHRDGFILEIGRDDPKHERIQVFFIGQAVRNTIRSLKVAVKGKFFELYRNPAWSLDQKKLLIHKITQMFYDIWEGDDRDYEEFESDLYKMLTKDSKQRADSEQKFSIVHHVPHETLRKSFTRTQRKWWGKKQSVKPTKGMQKHGNWEYEDKLMEGEIGQPFAKRLRPPRYRR